MWSVEWLKGLALTAMIFVPLERLLALNSGANSVPTRLAERHGLSVYKRAADKLCTQCHRCGNHHDGRMVCPCRISRCRLRAALLDPGP